MKKSITILLFAALVLSLSACGDNNGARNQDPGNLDTYNMQQNRNNNVDRSAQDRPDLRPFDNSYTNNSDRNGTRTGEHDNRDVEVSDEIAEQIADMSEVRSANVLVTNRNAYIAVVLDDDNNNTQNGTTRSGTNGQRNNGNNIGTNNANNTGTQGRNNNGMDMNMQGEDVSSQLKDQITDEVQRLKPNVRNVYISANPDFTDRVSGYMDEIDQGRPVRGLIDEFNTMVRRMFPDNNQ